MMWLINLAIAMAVAWGMDGAEVVKARRTLDFRDA